jgi:nucleoside-diphosphate kinase
MEETYIMVKPDAIKRDLVGKIIEKIENKGYKITNMKMFSLEESILREHYAHIENEPFFPNVLSFMTSGKVIGMIVEGENVIAGMRAIMGPTKEAPAGTIRGDFAFNGSENIIHGSDSIENAEIEIERFFN